jgi:uncharacterized OB-fold protein
MPYPIPVPDELSKPFWDACNEGRLVIQNCTACNRKQYPPQANCRQCGKADNLEWKQVEAKGTIIGYVVQHDTRVVMKKPDQPFNIAVVQLNEDPAIKFYSNLPGVPVDDVPVGRGVEVEFIDVGEGQKIHEWKVAG